MSNPVVLTNSLNRPLRSSVQLFSLSNNDSSSAPTLKFLANARTHLKPNSNSAEYSQQELQTIFGNLWKNENRAEVNSKLTILKSLLLSVGGGTVYPTVSGRLKSLEFVSAQGDKFELLQLAKNLPSIIKGADANLQNIKENVIKMIRTGGIDITPQSSDIFMELFVNQMIHDIRETLISARHEPFKQILKWMEERHEEDLKFMKKMAKLTLKRYVTEKMKKRKDNKLRVASLSLVKAIIRTRLSRLGLERGNVHQLLDQLDQLDIKSLARDEAPNLESFISSQLSMLNQVITDAEGSGSSVDLIAIIETLRGRVQSLDKRIKSFSSSQIESERFLLAQLQHYS
jgi:hypothetical protein